jgi:hypothetical protein
MSKKCFCLAAVCLTLSVAGSAGAQLGKGYVLFEYWDGIGGTSVDSNLRTNANFPDKPSASEWRTKFQSPSGRADNYGVRARAYLSPPETGDYTFWVSGDDNCQLWLSTDVDPAKAVMIAQVPGWTNVEEWGKYPEQTSVAIPLVAGQEYYLEGLMKEGGGGDSLDVGWAGPGIGAATTVIAGQYCTAFIRDPEPLFPALFQAKAPKPADKEIDVTTPIFEWTPGVGALTHDIYFGDTATLTAANFKMTMPAPMYFHLEPLVPGKTYYWRIDEVDAAGTKTEGIVWSFTVMPLEAHDPSPADGASFLPTAPTLSWTAGQAATTHDVYLSTDMAAVAAGDAGALMGTVGETHFHAPPLWPERTYYWRVDEVDGIAGKVPGMVWSFSTVPLVEKVEDPSLVGWWTFDLEPATSVAVLDMSGNGHYGALLGDGLAFVDDALLGRVLSLPGGNGKYVSIGAVGISGNDPTTIACWAKANSTSIPDWTLIFGFTGTADGQGGNGSHLNIGSLGGPGGVGAHCWGWEETIFTDNEALEWHHYAVTYDGTTIRYYGDGVEMDTDVAKSNVQDLSIRGDRVHIGKRVTQESSFPGLVDDCRVYNKVLDAGQITEIAMALAASIVGPADITSPRDIVVGVPNDGDWPSAESPMLAVDNRTNTKYLHRKGGKMPTGVQISPYAGPTIVTGITFTTANDDYGRDPIKYELYGANGNDPWTLIAAGDIVDFNQPDVWPRFTKNATPITFENSTAYEHYQLLFPAVRNPDPATLMQIGEIELIGGTTSQIISMVVRAGGRSGNRAPVGAFDGNSQVLPTEPGGLKDGNLVYSDRTYPWNQTPAELVGAEYIRIFNTDKEATPPATYTVTTSRLATIAVAHDDRNQPAQDAVDKIVAAFTAPGTFQDTGIDIFIYESASTPARPLSVFAADLPAGTYVFATEQSSNTMYIIGAIEKQ